MSLRFYNTLSKKKESFEPVEPGKVGIYLCGPTVYKDSHIGHAVGPVIFDALKKYLAYKGYQVKLVINITDVDDKLIKESAELGIEMAELAERVSRGYFEAMEELGVDSVDEYPRATDHIEQIIELIQKLSEQDAAYVADGDVYFDLSKCAEYGKLSHRRGDDQVAGSRELAGSGKRGAGDFALWKAASENEVGWDSPWGRGRPGWHIECSAMSSHYLGQTFDIHGGGLDLVFPHHENEIAQSETATGQTFAKYWLHNGLTRIKTKAASGEWQAEKMSKSLGNIKTIKETLEEYPAQCVRFFLLSTHYRRPIDFSDEALAATQKGLMSIYRLLDRVERVSGEQVYQGECRAGRLAELAEGDADKALCEQVAQTQLRYLEALDDDFNTAGALAEVFELCTGLNRYIDAERLEVRDNRHSRQLAAEGARMVTSLGRILGLLEGPIKSKGSGDQLSCKLMALLIELRAEARQSKNFALADAIRDKLTEIGVQMEDRPDGSTGWQAE